MGKNLNRITFVGILSLSLLAMPFTSFAAEIDPFKLRLNAIQVDYRYCSPTLYDGEIYLPARDIFRVIGANLYCDEKQTVSAVNDVVSRPSSFVFEVRNNSIRTYKNDRELFLDHPPIMLDGRLMIPISLLYEIDYLLDITSY